MHVSNFIRLAVPAAPALCLATGLVGATFLAACQDEQLVIDPGGTSGQVCNPITGKPAGAAHISVTYIDEASGTEQLRETDADDEGGFELGGIGPGEHELVATTDAFTSRFPVSIASRATFPLVDTACNDRPGLPGTGTVGGQICNRHTGEVVTDATITVIAPDGTETVVQSDPATGNFSVSDVPEGTVVVSVTSPDYRKTYVVELEDGQDLIVEQSSDCAIPDPLFTGFVFGKVCAPGTNDQPLVGAEVRARWTGSDGDAYSEGPFVTLEDGSFIVDPIGPTLATNLVVTAEKDDFRFSWNVPVVNARVDDVDGIDLTADVGCQPLLPDDDRRYLVVEGQYDRIQDVLARMELDNVDLQDGVPADLTWAEELFATQEIIDDYDAVFVNCGVEELELATGLSQNAVRNIRRYVEQGGSLYVSDWAYELVEQAFPEKINFINADDVHDAAQVAVGGSYNVTVVDPELAAEVGNTMTIDFSFQLGTVISEVAPDVTIYLETDMQYRREGNIADVLPNTPVTVGFRHGLGQVIYTSFHQEEDETLDGPEDAVLRYLVFEL